MARGQYFDTFVAGYNQYHISWSVKIIKKTLSLLTIFFFTEMAAVSAHPFYVSLCQIDFNGQNRSLEISVKIFTDDLQTALRRRGIENLFLGGQGENPESNKYISGYLNDNLSISVDGKPLKISFLGKDHEDGATWCFLEVPNVGTFSNIAITNPMLIETFEGQSNLILVTLNGRTQSLLLKKGNTSGSLSF